MKILVVCQYYHPEPFRITDICEELIKRGHEVTVLTGLPNYPMGEIYEGYRKGEKRDEVINGVTIHRCETMARKQGMVHRVLNYVSYAYSSTRYVNKLDCNFDVVFVNQLSPVMMAKAGIAYKKKYGVKLVLYCLDLWPESLVSGAIKRGSVVYRLFHKLSANIYRHADRLLVTSKSFTKYFQYEFGISDVEYLPQYAETLFTPDQCRKIPDGNIDLMFAGNVGTAQSVKTIVEAARITAKSENIRWHIVGDGIELDALKKQADGLNNIVFHGRKLLEDMPKYYAMADAMLVTMQKDPVLSHTMPGKVQTYMAAGKPIIGAIDGETATIIRDAECGVCCSAEDAIGLVSKVMEFISADNKSALGSRAATYYNREFNKERFIGDLIKKLTFDVRSCI